MHLCKLAIFCVALLHRNDAHLHYFTPDVQYPPKEDTMANSLRIKPGLLERLRETRNIPSEDHQARLIGVDRTTLRRVDAGATPSGAFMANFCAAFGLGLGEAFEVVESQSMLERLAS